MDPYAPDNNDDEYDANNYNDPNNNNNNNTYSEDDGGYDPAFPQDTYATDYDEPARWRRTINARSFGFSVDADAADHECEPMKNSQTRGRPMKWKVKNSMHQRQIISNNNNNNNTSRPKKKWNLWEQEIIKSTAKRSKKKK